MIYKFAKNVPFNVLNVNSNVNYKKIKLFYKLGVIKCTSCGSFIPNNYFNDYSNRILSGSSCNCPGGVSEEIKDALNNIITPWCISDSVTAPDKGQ